MTMTNTDAYPATPDSSLYLTCLDLALRGNPADKSGSVTQRADAFFDALKAKTS